jgi:S-adenosylhomocysteine hydrolase
VELSYFLGRDGHVVRRLPTSARSKKQIHERIEWIEANMFSEEDHMAGCLSEKVFRFFHAASEAHFESHYLWMVPKNLKISFSITQNNGSIPMASIKEGFCVVFVVVLEICRRIGIEHMRQSTRKHIFGTTVDGYFWKNC